ncbi:MAG TPA: hypothetical protein EYP90_09850, partial [Chromatiaceae bacterium]|nr:hypothetical protein [Chromatiaceae bacterium]
MSFASIARRTYYQQSSIAVAVILMMASYGWGNGQIWKAQTLVIKRIMPLPLKPVPRPPTPGEYKRGLREFQEGGPAMIVIHRERIYFVDDRDGVLLESDFKGKIYRRLILYRRASNILSGPLAVGGKILWVEIDHQVFGVNLESWRIVSVRKWREPQKGFKLTGMYAMSDNQL